MAGSLDTSFAMEDEIHVLPRENLDALKDQAEPAFWRLSVKSA